MRTEKVSLTPDQGILAEAREAVGDLEQENGPIEPRVMEEVRRAWPSSEEHSPKRRNA